MRQGNFEDVLNYFSGHPSWHGLPPKGAEGLRPTFAAVSGSFSNGPSKLNTGLPPKKFSKRKLICLNFHIDNIIFT